uniref:Uncharacterized protein n=1 Tax=Kalanchoe fedtschenkoi TaxID=63787 RepID=A0A7N0TJY6_KALFE
MASFSDMFLEFPPAQEASAGGYLSDEEEENLVDSEESRKFWEAQSLALEGTLYRSNSLESKIRNLTKEAVKEVRIGGNGSFCTCRRPVANGCLDCLMREVSGKLRAEGLNSAICRTKWRKTVDIPSGEHSFIDVVDNSNPKRGEVRIIIDLSFRAQFEMARAGEDYNRLIHLLPEVIVGKAERLEAVIKILCAASKKCMKERKMHMGPWRKLKYVQAKWLGVCERTSSLGGGFGLGRDRAGGAGLKPKASMLRFDLMRGAAVEVV